MNYGLYTYTMEDIIAQSLQSIMQGADMDETLKTRRHKRVHRFSTHNFWIQPLTKRSVEGEKPG